MLFVLGLWSQREGRRRVDDEPPHSRLPAHVWCHAALLLAREVARPGAFGLTLDLGHLLAAGEHPAHSVALVGTSGMLFGLHVSAWVRTFVESVGIMGD